MQLWRGWPFDCTPGSQSTYPGDWLDDRSDHRPLSINELSHTDFKFYIAEACGSLKSVRFVEHGERVHQQKVLHFTNLPRYRYWDNSSVEFLLGRQLRTMQLRAVEQNRINQRRFVLSSFRVLPQTPEVVVSGIRGGVVTTKTGNQELDTRFP